MTMRFDLEERENNQIGKENRYMENQKKIVIIGPVYPYKGGIAHYTALMFRALAGIHDVTLVSYSMQYPKFLFKREQRDYKNKTFKIDEAVYWINTANPFSCMKAARRINKMNPDVVMIQWWHPYFAPCYDIMMRFLKKKIRKIIVCHNVFPHERFVMDRQLTKLVLGKGDAFIVHSELDKNDLLEIKPNAVFKKTFIPTYNAFKLNNITKGNAREMLDLPEDEKVLLFFGFVREYKGLKWLIKAMPLIIKRLSNVKLLIVGDFGTDKDVYLSLMEECGITNAIEVYDGYIPDGEVEKYFAACDLVVCPYESATQSAIVQTAYGFEKPVVATNVGGLPEVVEDNRTGYVVESKDPVMLAERICEFYEKDKEKEFHKHIIEAAYKFSWDRMGEVVEELNLLGRKHTNE